MVCADVVEGKFFDAKIRFGLKKLEFYAIFSSFSSGPPSDGSTGFSRGRGGGSAGRGGFNLGDNGGHSGISSFNTVDPNSGSVQNQGASDNPFDNPNTQVWKSFLKSILRLFSDYF